MRRAARRLLSGGVRVLGYDLRIQRPVKIEPWTSDPEFLRLMEGVRGRTLVDDVRCFILHQHVRGAARLPGQVAEIGVFRGGTARLLARAVAARGKTVHLFDTFAGMPATDPERDLHRAGDFADTSLPAVREYLRDTPNVRFHPGLFPQTAGPVEGERFCFVHVDVDIHASVRDCCEFFWPRLVPGGVMVFDDYGFLSCPGARLAVDEFFAGRPEAPCYLPTGQCVAVRGCDA
jgi:O-methyltransferase